MPHTVTLRDITLDDLPILYEHQRDPASSAMAAVPSRDWDAHLAHWTRILASSQGEQQAILLDGQVVGNLVAFDHDGTREIGYRLDRAYWGKGIATQALALFLQRIQTRPLYGRVVSHNIGSQRVLQKNGFVVIGEEHEVDDDGPITVIVFRLDAGAESTTAAP